MGDATRESPIPLQAHIISPLGSYHKPLYVKNLSFAAYPLPPDSPLVLQSTSLSRAPLIPPPRISAPAFLLVSGRSQAYTPARWKRFSLPLAKKVAKTG